MDYRIKKILLKPLDFIYNRNPELALKILYRIQTGENLSLDNPIKFNEKIQWLKLYYRNPIIPKLVDKYSVRKYVADKGLESTLNELIWEGFDPKEIPFDSLPEKFVIKATHGQGFNIICTDKNNLDYEKTTKQLQKWLDTDFLPSYGEWFYGIEKPRVIIEKFLEGNDGTVPDDYKVFCFNGEPEYIRVTKEVSENTKHNVYDVDWKLKKGYSMGFENFKEEVEKPDLLEEIIRISKILSDGFPHVRVDFFIIKNNIFFGEMTFTSGAGFGSIEPEEFNIELGNYIQLPKEEIKD